MNKLVMILTGLLVLALIAGMSACGGDETTTTTESITLKFPYQYPVDSGYGEVNELFAELVEEYTDGRVIVEVFPRSTLVRGDAEFDAVKTGLADVVNVNAYYLSAYNFDFLAFVWDGHWESWEHGFAVMDDGRVPQQLLQGLEQAEAPVEALGWTPGPQITAMYITKDKEIKRWKDVEGYRVGVPEGGGSSPVIDYSGVIVVPLSYEEQYTAWTQGVIDAIMCAPSQAVELRFYEIGNHALIYTFSFMIDWFLMNEGTWNSLPADIQNIILNQVMPEVMAFAREKMPEVEAENFRILQEELETVNFVTPESHPEDYAQLDGTSMGKLFLNSIDPEIKQIIDELRPSRQ
ncbi:MAG: TRAP transporter substrate-binding protein DctP [Dehalococcoidia bacterium]|nr:MAG: TRAP transporter substrate-binding protein DctP [Dehalococcoidia bacterium]